MNKRILRAVAEAFVLSWVLLAIWTPATALAAVPGNDNFANRIVINPFSLPYANTQDTTGATAESGEPSSSCGTVTNSVWYQFTPDISYVYMLDTYGSSYDTVIDIFTSSATPASLASLVSVNCNNDFSSPSDTSSFMSMPLVGGTTYYIRVSSAAGSGGTSVLNVLQGGAAVSPTGSAGGNPYIFGSWANQSVTVTLNAVYNDPSNYPTFSSGLPVTGVFYSVDGSPVQDYSAPFVVTGEGVHSVQYGSDDPNGRGSITHTAPVNIDLTKPTTSASATAGGNPYTFDTWTNQDVTVTLTANDTGGSGVANSFYKIGTGATQTYSDPFTITTEGIYTIAFWSTDNAGNVESQQTVTVKLDKSGPTISGAPTTSPNSNNWYNSPVTIHWTCADPNLGDGNPGSGIATCPVDEVINGEGMNLTVNGTATDNAGNSTTVASSPPVNIDMTAPTITYTGNQGSYTVDQTVNITCSATDNLSGIDSTDCQDITGPAYSFNLGQNSFSSTATDNAGNVGNGSVDFNVGVTVDSLIALTKQFDSNRINAIQISVPLRYVKLAEALHNEPFKHFSVIAYQLLVYHEVGRNLTVQEANTLIRLSNAL